MPDKDSLPEDEAKPVGEATHADKQNAEREVGESASLQVVQPPDTEDDEPQTAESNDETNRKQDETLAAIAEQTASEAEQAKWLKKQTFWAMAQTTASSFLGIATLGVLVYHSMMMRGQLKATNETVEVMKGQLKSMESSSAQTQQMLEASQKSADASQAIAGQNRDLVGHAGEQAVAMNKQADASATQAEASTEQAESMKQLAGATETSARAAELNARTAAQSFGLAERAYIAIDGASMNLVAEQPLVITITFINRGRTPAKRFLVAAHLSWGGKFVPPVWSPKYHQEIVGSFIPAEAKKRVVFDSLGVILTRQEVAEINAGTRKLFFGVEAHYFDHLDREQVFAFCSFYVPAEKDFSECMQQQ